MSVQWYCLIDDQEYGPYSSEELRIMASNGQLQSTHSIRRDRQAPWTPATQVKGLFSAVPDPPPSPPPAATPRKPPAAAPARAKPPVAKPVAAAVPEAIPVGTPVATTDLSPPSGASLKPSVPAIHAEDGHLSPRPRRSGNKAIYVVAVLGGLLLAFVCLGIFAVARSRGTGEDAQVVAAAEDDSPSDTNFANPETDPETDPVDAPASASKGTPSSKHPAPNRGTTWLDASSQKGGLRSVARFHVAEARLDDASADDKMLKLEVHVRNDDREKAMEFRPWNASIDHTDALGALLFDPSGECLKPAPSTAVSGVRTAATRVAPGETITQELVYLVPAANAQDYRLLLPYAAVGRRGEIGFEIPGIMLKTLPEGEETELDRDEPGGPQPTTGEAEPPAEADSPPQPDATETPPAEDAPMGVQAEQSPVDMDALRRSIESTAGDGSDDATGDDLPGEDSEADPADE